MPKTIEVSIFPPITEEAFSVEHTPELVLLDKQLYLGELPLVGYGLASEDLQSFSDIPSPRSNTYVLNLKGITLERDMLRLKTNYTTMRSQFALRRWVPTLSENNLQRELILHHVRPLAVTMLVETADNYILMEERGNVEIPGKYHPAPAGGCETRHWQNHPDPFRCIKGEAWEEIGLLPDKDYQPPMIIGLVRDQTEGFNPSLIYHTKTFLSLDAICQNADSIAPEAGEHQRLFGAPIHPEHIREFCQQNMEKIIGNGLGMLLVFGQYKFGSEWFSDAVQDVCRSGWKIKNY